MAALSNIVHLVYFQGLDTTPSGTPVLTSVNENVGLGPNGRKAGLVLVNVLDLTRPGEQVDIIGAFVLTQSYTHSIANGGIIQYGLFQLVGFNYGGRTLLAIFSGPENIS